MVSSGRHPKKQIAAALDGLESCGFTVRRVRNKGHLWGKLVCVTCGEPEGALSIYSTPRNEDVVAKRIFQFRRKHDH